MCILCFEKPQLPQLSSDMLKSFQVFIIFFSFIQTGLAQKNSELKIYSVGDYQIEINLPKSWYPMSPEKIATIAKESELQRIRQGTFDYVSTTSFAELENNPISSLIGSYAIVDSAQKILIQSQLDSLLEKTGNSFKDQSIPRKPNSRQVICPTEYSISIWSIRKTINYFTNITVRFSRTCLLLSRSPPSLIKTKRKY